MEFDKKAYAEQQRRKRLSRNLRVIRRSLGLSEQELAERAGYKNGAMIVAIENGSAEPSYDKIRDLANALGVSIPQLRGSGRKIDITEEGWPKLSESERMAISLFAPIIDSLDEFGIEHLLNTALLVCKANGVEPKWKRPDYREKN